MDIKFKGTINPRKKKVIITYQGCTDHVGDIIKKRHWEFYPLDIPIGRLTMDRIENELELMNLKIREELLSSPLRVTFFQSKINKK
jgi:hypothetical protein